MKDITLRALEVLKMVDGIICEDTRRTALLLNHYSISKPLFVLNDFNEAKTVPVFLKKLQGGDNLALVSDAGTPLIADPGFKLVRECLKEAIPVDSLPGPSAPIVALTLSGLPPDKFMFLGYPPEKQGQREKMFTSLKTLPMSLTVIMFISPHKLLKTLTDFNKSLGDKEICLAKELTKIHQSSQSKPVSFWLEYFKDKKPKGEFVLLCQLSHS